jgi:hypothetical protein
MGIVRNDLDSPKVFPAYLVHHGCSEKPILHRCDVLKFRCLFPAKGRSYERDPPCIHS